MAIALVFLRLMQLPKHYLDRFLVGPTLTVSFTVVAGLLLASFLGTNLPVRASRTLLEFLLIMNYIIKFTYTYAKNKQKISMGWKKKI